MCMHDHANHLNFSLYAQELRARISPTLSVGRLLIPIFQLSLRACPTRSSIYVRFTDAFIDGKRADKRDGRRKRSILVTIVLN